MKLVIVKKIPREDILVDNSILLKSFDFRKDIIRVIETNEPIKVSDLLYVETHDIFLIISQIIESPISILRIYKKCVENNYDIKIIRTNNYKTFLKTKQILTGFDTYYITSRDIEKICKGLNIKIPKAPNEL